MLGSASDMTGRVLGALYAWQSAEHRYMRYTSVCVVQKNVYVSASAAPYSQPATVPYVLLGMHRSHWQRCDLGMWTMYVDQAVHMDISYGAGWKVVHIWSTWSTYHFF
eukprot:COSAG01_NODE_861_length_13035_cov_6.890449_16_plen_108_part_00